MQRKIVISLIALLLLSLAPMWAQTAQTGQTPDSNAPNKTYSGRKGRHGQKGSRRHMARLAQELNLTQEQRQKLEPIFQQQMQQMRATREDTSLTPEQRRVKMDQLRQSTHSQINSVLTPEQQEKFKQLREKHGPGMGGPGRGPGMSMRGPGAGMGPLARLNLTPDQQAKLKPIFEDTHSKMQALHQDTSLTPEQRREKARQIWQNSQAQINTILTPEQKQQWEQMRERRGRRMGPPASGF